MGSPTTTRTTLAEDSFRLGGDLRIGLGTMRLTDATGNAEIWTAGPDPAAAIAVLRRAVDLGVTLIDTADSYALGEGEELVARALHPYPDDLVVATKVGVTRPGPGEWVPVGHPAYLRQQAELSLRRLRVETIDLLQLHRIDAGVPLADQLGALRQLRDEGKVRHIGLSEVTAGQLEEALAITPVASVQNLYNLTSREHDPVVELTARLGVAFLPFFPIGAGAHTRAGGALAEVATELGATPAQVALAWLLHRAPNVIPIPGTGSADHLAENVAAGGISLSPGQFARLFG
jgi:pyridoxine 4-dehydrogenase